MTLPINYFRKEVMTMDGKRIEKLKNVDKLSQMVGAELICYFPGKQCTRIPLTAVQMALIEDTLGLQLQDGVIRCYTDKRLEELYLDDEDEVVAVEK